MSSEGATSLPTTRESDDSRVVGCDQYAALRTRVGERNVEKPVLSPGMHWVALPDQLLRLRDPARSTLREARPDEHTICGWCLAHSTSTAIS